MSPSNSSPISSPGDPAGCLWRFWQQGERPDLAEFLRAAGDLTPAQLLAVARIDQTQRWRSGERVPAEAYLLLAPALREAENALVLLLGECQLREQLGEAPSLDEYLGRFPQYAEALRLQFSLNKALAEDEPFTVPQAGEQGQTTPPAPAPSSNGPAWPDVPGYEILGELGRGGMGVVYKARQVGLNRTVALKMIHGGAWAEPEALARFRGEAEVAARFQHPNIVQVHEIGDHEGRPFFSLEYVAGGSLANRLAGKPLEPPQAAALALTLARTVQYAHERGVVHRDLKPANILLQIADSSLQIAEQSTIPKIADFGLAKCLDNDPGRTQSGVILGTPSYMAPEQAAGRAQDVGPAADLYALGTILYEMLTGRPPFRGATLLDTLEQVRGHEPVSPRQLQPKVPRDLETICLKCLEKEPARRYADAQRLADDLERFLDGRPIQARPAGVAERAWKWARRRPALATLLVGGNAALVLILVLLALAYQARGQSLVAAEKQVQAEQEAREKAGLAAQAEQVAREKAGLAARAEAGLRRVASRAEALLSFEKGADLCERGEVNAGSLWLARALDGACRAEDSSLERVVRINLASWRRQLVPSAATLPHEGILDEACFIADGRTLVTCERVMDRGETLLSRWNVAEGKRAAAPVRLRDALYVAGLSPDGQTALVVDRDEIAQLWDLEPLKRRGRPLGQKSIRVVAFGAGGRVLTGGPDRTARLWDATSGEPVGPGFAHAGEVVAVAFSRDGRRALTGSGNAARLWDVATGQPVGGPLAHEGKVRSVAFSPDGTTILTAGEDRTARLWDGRTGLPLGEPLRHAEAVTTALFSPDGALIATQSGPVVQLWEAATGTPVGQPLRETRRLPAGAFAPDGRHFVTFDASAVGHARMTYEARVWERPAGNAAGPPLLGAGAVRGLGFTADGRDLLVLSDAHQAAAAEVRRWNAVTGALAGPVWEHRGKTTTWAFHAGSLRLLHVEESSTRLWDVAAEAPRGKPLPHPLPVTGAAFGRDGRFALTICGDNRQGRQLRAWDAGTGQPAGPPVWVVKPPPNRLIVALQLQQTPLLAISPDGRTALVVKNSHNKLANAAEAALWDLTNGRQTPLPRSYDLYAFAFSPDGKTVVTGGEDHEARLWGASDGKPIGPPLVHEDAVLAAEFSPDGRAVLTGSADGTARLWDTTTGRPLGQPLAQGAAVQRVTFSPDGHTIATAGVDGAVRLWDVATTRPLGAPLRHRGSLAAVTFSADGQNLATGGPENSSRVWQLPTPLPGEPEQILLGLQAQTRLELDADGVLRSRQ
jgi:WD40 repeat protein